MPKKTLLFFVIVFIFISVFAFKTNSSYASGGMNGYMTNLLSDVQSLAPTAYAGQQRGFFVGGSMEIPPQGTTIQPFSATLPHLSFNGCGGIDLTMGGFSYLNFKYLVQKLQGILQAAPAFAFEIGLKVLSEQAGGVMNDLEAATNAVNDLNLNSCKSMNNIVSVASNTINSSINNLKAKQSTANSQATGGGSWFGGALTGVVNNVKSSWSSFVKNSTSGASQQTGGSNPLVSFGLPSSTPSMLDLASSDVSTAFPQLIPIMRYYAGDVTAINGVGTPVHAVAGYIPACNPESTTNYSALAKDIVEEGQVHGANINTSSPSNFCSNVQQYTFTPLKQQVQQDVLNIITSIQTDSQISQQGVDLINSSPLPILPFLQVIALSNNPAVISSLTGPLAKTIAYSIVAQLINETSGMVSQGAGNVKLSLENGTKTNAGILNASKSLLKHLDIIAESANNEYMNNYKKTIAIYGNFLQIYRKYKDIVQKGLNKYQLAASYSFQKTVGQGE
ncbi:MAG: conjugal transfer protein TraH [bacterium]